MMPSTLGGAALAPRRASPHQPLPQPPQSLAPFLVVRQHKPQRCPVLRGVGRRRLSRAASDTPATRHRPLAEQGREFARNLEDKDRPRELKNVPGGTEHLHRSIDLREPDRLLRNVLSGLYLRGGDVSRGPLAWNSRRSVLGAKPPCRLPQVLRQTMHRTKRYDSVREDTTVTRAIRSFLVRAQKCEHPQNLLRPDTT